ncbi:YlbD family protein [Peribacillus kribbensis]|uniref:YlbD family protein n=1 Tax=Peribacillus kribbensis TaxID=356658 RepID=UPI000425423F|nr:YlbD family protein [Peribacillus kribbensis]
MTERNESIEQFKLFVKKYPGLVQEVRKGRQTWQDIYEEWFLLGEEDPKWDEYSAAPAKTSAKEEKDSKSDLVSTLFSAIKNMDMEQIQTHISSLSQAISAVQGILTQFQSNPENAEKPKQPPNPFALRKD